ncbi:PadR family transcriptional regulator [Pseudoalteromonas sp. SSM20]|uniref:PadR family transcriptional regulator n=1 Tax=Pseudoalteromonas sp. SSM20 TaxID=3139394 RepID=UPI003BA8DE2E
MGKSDKFLGEFEQMVLLALLQLKDNAYGAAIRQLLDQQIERTVALGALYATLERLENKGLVSSKLGEATPERGGRPKRFFTVTNDGLNALQRAKDAMDTLWQNLPNHPFEV